MKFRELFIFFLALPGWLLFADEDPYSRLLDDLLIVEYWNQRLSERMPVTYNHLLQGGYISMPSARVGQDGEIGFGYAWVPPYINYNLRVQLADRLEVTGNYRIFKGVEDPILSPLGFGDLSDKGANLKLALFHPEDSDYRLPGLAIGFDDFIGTRAFRAKYIVATKVFLDWNLETSFGYGTGRIRGCFGGLSWMPFRTHCSPFLKGLSLVAEYDAIPYKKHDIEKHPKGREKKSPINVGVKYRLFDQFDLSASYIRGCEWAFSVSGFYNFGYTKGLLPKIDDPLPYQAPVVTEPLGPRRPEDAMVADLLYAMRRQGIELMEASLTIDSCCNQVLRLKVYNEVYRLECDLRARLNNLLAYLVPSDIHTVIVEIDSSLDFSVQEYHFTMEYVREYASKEMGAFELMVLSPVREVTTDPPELTRRIFKQRNDLWNLELFPKFRTLFGSSRGKFKYALGLNLDLNGFLWEDIYYSIRFGCIFFTDLDHLTGIDRLNPSRLLNVRTELMRYLRQRGLTIDEAYVQKNWNLGRGWYGRVTAGLFEEMYGGIGGEVLYYPVCSRWAFGVEAAFLRKRHTRGIWFSDKVRKVKDFIPTWHHFLGSQYFVDFYYEWQEAQLDFKVKAGKFLANDYGARFEATRYFPSGLEIGIWYTLTNGNDKINGKVYHDKGIFFSVPIDIFYTRTDRTRWGYGMSAWLRDVGASVYTGQGLHELIREQRSRQ